MEKRTAIVFGATGLVGRALVDQLCNSTQYELITVFVRKNSGIPGRGKINEILIDFERIEDYSDLIKGNDLFICLGTTIKKAGKVSRMEEIDCTLPVKIATIASANMVEKLAAVSSLGADSDSANYYLRIKGEMENGLLGLKFKTIAILRPSILLGVRTERRFGEEIGKILMRVFGIFLVGKLAKYRGIDAKKVAAAMIRILNEKTGIEITESDRLQQYKG